MKEVTELIQALQQRLKNAGGGKTIITDKNFTIKLKGNAEAPISSMTYEELEQDVLTYVENCSAGSLVNLFNFIHNCNADVEWDGEDNPNVIK